MTKRRRRRRRGAPSGPATPIVVRGGSAVGPRRTRGKKRGVAVHRWAGLGGHYRARSCRRRRGEATGRRQKRRVQSTDDIATVRASCRVFRSVAQENRGKRGAIVRAFSTVFFFFIRISPRVGGIQCVCVCGLASVRFLYCFRSFIDHVFFFFDDSGRVRSRYGQPTAVSCCCCCRARARASNAPRANGSYGHTC